MGWTLTSFWVYLISLVGTPVFDEAESPLAIKANVCNTDPSSENMIIDHQRGNLPHQMDNLDHGIMSKFETGTKSKTLL